MTTHRISGELNIDLALYLPTLMKNNISHHYNLGQKKIMNCFSGTAASVLKAPHYFILLLSKNKKSHISFIIGNNHAVSLGHCGPLRVMLGSLFIHDSISGFPHDVFYCVLPQQCKFYASIYPMCRGFHYQVLWPD